MNQLSNEQRQQIKAELAQRRIELIAEIRDELARSGHEHFVDLAGEVADTGDSSVADMLVDRNIATISAEVEELTQIERAQLLVDKDEFGACEECGASIGFARLQVMPQASRCIKCQEQYEKNLPHSSTTI